MGRVDGTDGFTWASREERTDAARAEYERINTTPSPPLMTAYIDAGVLGFVFGEMWRREVLTARDRRWITLSCVGAAGTAFPIESHVWAALNSGDLSPEEFDEFVLHFATQMGWPRASVMQMYGMQAIAKMAEERGTAPAPLAFIPWADPVRPETRRSLGEAAYQDVHGAPPPTATTAFRGHAYLDFLYGEIWTREAYLTRRDRRIISICCSAAVGAERDTREHLTAALGRGELTYEELQELVVHYAVYVGWPLGRQLDDLLAEVVGAA
jgi:4-carboxymuconolactone decarboxylase